MELVTNQPFEDLTNGTFDNASETSYIYILSGQKFMKKSKPFGQKFVENAKIQKFKMRLFWGFSNTLLDEESSHVNFFLGLLPCKRQTLAPLGSSLTVIERFTSPVSFLS